MSSAQPSTSTSIPAPIPDPVADNFKVFRPPVVVNATLPQLPESYFTPTVADLSAAQSTLQARREALVNRPLTLKKDREEAERKKRERWPEVSCAAHRRHTRIAQQRS